MKIPNEILQLFKTSVFITVLLYGLRHVLIDVIYSVLPVSLIVAAALTAVIHFYRVSAPCSEDVDAIVGPDLLLSTGPSNFTGNDGGRHQTAGSCPLKAVAHRGAPLDAPENSLAAFKLCHSGGCDWIEFDIQSTADDVIVVFHDDTLKRLADLDLKVKTSKWTDLKDVDIAVKHPFRDRFTPTKITTLDVAVEQLLASNQRMIIDIKENNTKMVNVIHGLFEKNPVLYSKAIVSSFFPNLIYLIRKGNPKIVCSLAWRPYFFAYESYSYPEGVGPRRYSNIAIHFLLMLLDKIHEWTLERITYQLLGLSIILLHKDAISAKVVLEWRKKGVRVMAWTANSRPEKQFFSQALKITHLTDTLADENNSKED